MSLEAARDLPIPDLLRVLSERLGLERTGLSTSLRATPDLSIPDLLHALSEELGSERTRVQETTLPPKSKVSAPLLTHPDKHGGRI